MGAKMSVRKLKEADLRGKLVLVRVDLNVLLGDNSKITCGTRDRGALPNIKHLLTHGAKVILFSHSGSREDGNSKKSVKTKLTQLLGTKVQIAYDIIGENVANPVAEIQGGMFNKKKKKKVIQEGDVLWLLESVFNDSESTKKLASLVDLYVDEFGIARTASTERMIKYLKSNGKKIASKAFCGCLPIASLIIGNCVC